jgi:SAM-dependent methyltransferase
MGNNDTRLYTQPLYYDLAFSFRDIPKEVACFEECIRRFSRIPVHRVLELACGPAPHLGELARRGFAYVGVDVSAEMLGYAAKRAAAGDTAVEFVQASMIDFALKEPADFVFVALGSLYARSTSELACHLASVSRALQPGGLYFLDWCIQFGGEATGQTGGESWQIERDGIRVRARVTAAPVDQVEQLLEETITLEVEDHGATRTLTTTDLKRAIYPQEMLRVIEARRDFSFVGWWNNWDLGSPLGQVKLRINRPIVILRREAAA